MKEKVSQRLCVRYSSESENGLEPRHP
jgi:hypothetical protein